MSVNPIIHPFSDTDLFDPKVAELRLAAQELRLECDRLNRRVHELESDPMYRFLKAAEHKGFVIQLIPERMYHGPIDAD